jgi:lysozyme
MRITEEGLALIKRFEGFRSRAYRCSAGVWTIGYGHTSMAGAPEVTPDLEVSRADAEVILRRDVAKFAEGVAARIARKLTAPQFSALVSFAYNVGLGNFAKSSVLKAVNAGDFDAVPRRLQMWVKAGGRTLPGLVRRRAAEAELFASGKADEELPRVVEPASGKPAHESTTTLAAIVSALAGIATTLLPIAREAVDIFAGPTAAIVLMAVIVGAAFWIIRERRRKSAEEGI